MREIPQRIRNWLRDVAHRFWSWLFVLSASRLTLEDRIDLLDEDWWHVVRYRLRELANSDLGQNFIRTVIMDDEPSDEQGRDYRDLERDVRDYRVSG